MMMLSLLLIGTVEHLDPAAFQKALATEHGLTLDVRTAAEVAKGQLKDATVIDFLDPHFADRAALMQKDRAIFVYCAAGGRSARAAEKLSEIGFTKVYDLDGGIIAWKAAGLPIVTPKGATKKPTPGLEPAAFDAIIHAAPLALVVYGTEWCTPCRKMAEVVNALAATHKDVTVVRVDLEASDALAKREKVTSVPTFVVYANGKERSRKQGELTLAHLEAILR